ncbi:hypothetical protein Tco_0676434 [Tanacetum coccineum]
MSLMDVKKGSDSKSDDILNLTGSKVEMSRNKELKKFDFITENGDYIHLTKEQIKTQKKIEESAKAEAAKHEYDKLLGQNLIKSKAKITQTGCLDEMGAGGTGGGGEQLEEAVWGVERESASAVCCASESKVILNFKASDLHLGEWREPIKACPNKKGKGWSTIYEQIQTKMDYLYKAKAKLGIDVDKPLNEQDLIDKLNDLANKKRKNANDIHDYF